MSQQAVPQARPLAALGGSSTEAFDYLFGDQPLYHPLWASGWSARGLDRSKGRAFLAAVVADLPRDATVLLNFGMVDVLFGLPHKVRQDRFYDFSRFLEETAQGIASAFDTLHGLGFERVQAVSLSAVPVLPPGYWERHGVPRLPAPMLGQMLLDLAARLAALGFAQINLLPQLIESPERPVLKPRFRRKSDDHHPDYIKLCPLLWQAMRHLPDLPPPRDPPLTALYPHQPYPVEIWQITGQPRPRSLR